MRKIIESTLVSADGVVGSPPLWAMGLSRRGGHQGCARAALGSDAMLMGRGTYELFATIWPGQTDDFAQRINGIRKYVFSSTLASADWSNSTIVRGDVLAEARKIKEQDGRTWPCSAMAAWRDAAGERSDRRTPLSVHPILAGAGLPQFSNGSKRR